MELSSEFQFLTIFLGCEDSAFRKHSGSQCSPRYEDATNFLRTYVLVFLVSSSFFFFFFFNNIRRFVFSCLSPSRFRRGAWFENSSRKRFPRAAPTIFPVAVTTFPATEGKRMDNHLVTSDSGFPDDRRCLNHRAARTADHNERPKPCTTIRRLSLSFELVGAHITG